MRDVTRDIRIASAWPRRVHCLPGAPSCLTQRGAGLGPLGNENRKEDVIGILQNQICSMKRAQP